MSKDIVNPLQSLVVHKLRNKRSKDMLKLHIQNSKWVHIWVMEKKNLISHVENICQNSFFVQHQIQF